MSSQIQVRKYRKRGLLFSLLFMVALSSVNAQSKTNNTYFHHFDMEDGLSNSWISDIVEDQMGFIWIATQYGINRYDGNQFDYYTYDPYDTLSLTSNWVMEIREDQSGKLWLGAFGHGLHSFDPGTRKIQRHLYNSSDPAQSPIQSILSIHVDADTVFYLGTRTGELYKYALYPEELELIYDEPSTRVQEILSIDEEVVVAYSNALYTIDKEGLQPLKKWMAQSTINCLAASPGFLWVGATDGLYQFAHSPDLDLQLVQKWLNVPVNDLAFDKTDLWIASNSGLHLLDTGTGSVEHFIHERGQENSLLEGALVSLLVDKVGNLWIGGEKGLCVLSKNYDWFRSDKMHPSISELSKIKAITSSREVLWLGGDSGLWQYDMNQHMNPPDQILTEPVRSLLFTSDKVLFVGMQANLGLYRIDISSGQMQKFSSDPESSRSIIQGEIWSLSEDTTGGVIISTLHGVDYFDPNENEFLHLTQSFMDSSMSEMFFLATFFDNKNRLWLGTIEGGLFRMDWQKPPSSKTLPDLTQYVHERLDSTSLSSNLIQHITQARDGTIWLCTDGGFNRLIDSTGQFIRYTRRDGLVDDKILSAEEDQSGRMWFSTISHGLLAWNVEEESGTFFGKDDGLYHDAFLLKASHTTDQGIMLFANEGGVQIFDPDLIHLGLDPDLELYFTDLRLNGEPVEIGQTLMPNAPEFTTELQFQSHQNNLSFSFALPGVLHSKNLKFEYLLDGSSKLWIPIENPSNISFNQLSSGRYNLVVRACSAQNCIQSKPLNFVIRPPIHLSTGALILYVLLLASILYFIYHFQLKRKLERQKQLQQQDAIEAKTRFYTNMTHEFRTPLTLISGPAQRLRKSGDFKESDREQLETIERNAAHLLRLVNDVLDVSRGG